MTKPAPGRWIGLASILAVAGLGLVWAGLRDRAIHGPEPQAGVRMATDRGDREPVILDDRRQQLLGVRTSRAVAGTLAPKLRTVGTVKYDETRLTDVNLKLDGWIRELYVNRTGQHVQRGQPLLTLYSPDLITTEIQFLAALENREHVTPAQTSASPEYLDRLIDTPRQRLLRWDVPDDQLQLLERTRDLVPAVEFRSPATGVVVEKSVVNGMHVESGQTLYRIADLSTVWIEADFYESDVSLLGVGAQADIRLDAWPGAKFAGRISYVYPYMNQPTRTLKARIELANREGRLKPGMFATVEVSVAGRTGVLIPEDAVIDSGSRQMVFVAQGGGHFEPQRVVVGARSDGRVLVLEGLRENDEVAERAAFFLDSESQMRAALRNYESAIPAAGSQPADDVDLSVHTTPDPPRLGENALEVRVRDANGHLMAGADVQVLLSMPAMPSMNMPPMRSQATLSEVEQGVYRGPASILMRGRWDVTVSARREGRLMATKQLTLLAQ